VKCRAALFSLLVLAFVASCGPRTAPAEATARRRIAVGPFFAPEQDQKLRQISSQVPELLTAELSHDARFQTVDREQMRMVLRELDLSAGGLTDARTMLKLGQLVSADWLVSGSLVASSNITYIWTKVIDLQSGVVLDFQPFQLITTNLSLTLRDIAQFVASSEARGRRREYVGLSAFRDYTDKTGHPDLSREVQSVVEKHCFGRGIGVVEREAVNLLLQEQQLILGNLTTRTNARVKAEHAFWLVDGRCQWIAPGYEKLFVALRVQKVGFQPQVKEFTTPPGPELERALTQALEAAFTGPMTALDSSRNSEAAVHEAEGYKLATRRDPLPAPRGTYGTSPEEQNRKMQDQQAILEQNRRELIKRYEAALLLNPTNLETKHMLGSALYASGGADHERGRQLLEEVAKSGDPSVVQRSRQLLDHLRFDDKGRPYIVGAPPQYRTNSSPTVASAQTLQVEPKPKPRLEELPPAELHWFFQGFVVLWFDKTRILIGEGSTFKILPKGGRTPTTNELPVKINSRITAIVANDQYIWLATAADGLLQLQRDGAGYRHFKRSDGLLFDSIAYLRLDDNRLWLGFADQELGGVGVLRIQEQSCITLATPPDLFGTKDRGSLAPQSSIKGIIRTRTGLFVASRYVLQYYDKSKDSWNLELNEPVRCVWSSPECDYVAAGGANGNIKIRRLGSERWQQIDLGEEWPHNQVEDLVMQGHDLWAISEFRLFHVDLRQMKADAYTVLKSSRGARKVYLNDEGVFILASGRQWGTTDMLFVRKPSSFASK